MRRLVLGSLAVVLCFVAASCADKPGEEKPLKESKKAEPQNKVGPPRGVIDAIDGDPVVGGGLSLRGWAADPSEGAPVKRIEIVLDGTVVAQASTGFPRPDVADAFHRADWLKSGWTAEIYLNNIKAGAHKIDVIAYDSRNLKGFLSGSKLLTVKAANQKSGT